MYTSLEQAKGAYVVRRIIKLPGVTGVYPGRDFISVNKEEDVEWMVSGRAGVKRDRECHDCRRTAHVALRVWLGVYRAYGVPTHSGVEAIGVWRHHGRSEQWEAAGRARRVGTGECWRAVGAGNTC